MYWFAGLNSRVCVKLVANSDDSDRISASVGVSVANTPQYRLRLKVMFVVVDPTIVPVNPRYVSSYESVYVFGPVMLRP